LNVCEKEEDKMKAIMKKVKSLICVMLLMTSVCILAGCGRTGSRFGTSGIEGSDTPQSISLVLGVHKYFPVLSLTTDSVYSKIYDACYSYGNLSAICIDGKPYVACNYNIASPDKHIDEAKRKQLAANNTKQIIADMSGISGKTENVDTLSAINLSAESLQSTDTSCQKTMIIYDSGLCSTGLMDMREKNFFDAPAEKIVAQLKELHAIPDMKNIAVTWVGLGTTCGEQNDLYESHKYKLKNLWEKILTAGGATVTFDSSPLSDEQYEKELPNCATIPIVADSLDAAELVTENMMPEVVAFYEDTSIKFKSDLAEFADVAKVEQELEPVAEYLRENPDQNIHIVGMTATVGELDEGKRLSLERAENVRRMLVNMGARKEQTHSLGLGHSPNPLRAEDIDGDGNLIEEQAKRNRAVFLIKSDSELVGTLLQCSGGI